MNHQLNNWFLLIPKPKLGCDTCHCYHYVPGGDDKLNSRCNRILHAIGIDVGTYYSAWDSVILRERLYDWCWPRFLVQLGLLPCTPRGTTHTTWYHAMTMNYSWSGSKISSLKGPGEAGDLDGLILKDNFVAWCHAEGLVRYYWSRSRGASVSLSWSTLAGTALPAISSLRESASITGGALCDKRKARTNESRGFLNPWLFIVKRDVTSSIDINRLWHNH